MIFDFKFLKLGFDIILGLFRVFRFSRARFLGTLDFTLSLKIEFTDKNLRGINEFSGFRQFCVCLVCLYEDPTRSSHSMIHNGG